MDKKIEASAFIIQNKYLSGENNSDFLVSINNFEKDTDFIFFLS